MHYDTPFNNVFENGILVGGYSGFGAAPSGSYTVEITGTLNVTGQSSFPDGTAAAPSVRVGDEQNGLYSPSAGTLGFAVVGTAVGVFNSSGVLTMYYGGTVPDGTAAAPSLKVGDEQNGLFSPAASNLGIATNGVERFRIDANGNMGLNGCTPASAWNTSYAGTQLGAGADAIMSPTTATGNLWLLSNAYYHTDTNFKYIISSAAPWSMMLSSANDGWDVRSAAAGTAGNSITWTVQLAVQRDKSLALKGATPQSGTGITFPATQSASSDANTLDDYEEGSWTPSTATANLAISTIHMARYTKVGRLVHATCYVNINNTSGGYLGYINIAGLPYTCDANEYGPCRQHYSGAHVPGDDQYGYVGATAASGNFNATNAFINGTAAYMFEFRYAAA